MVQEGEMPPWFYLPLHPHTRLSDADRAAIEAWTGAPPPGAHGHLHAHAASD